MHIVSIVIIIYAIIEFAILIYSLKFQKDLIIPALTTSFFAFLAAFFLAPYCPLPHPSPLPEVEVVDTIIEEDCAYIFLSYTNTYDFPCDYYSAAYLDVAQSGAQLEETIVQCDSPYWLFFEQQGRRIDPGETHMVMVPFLLSNTEQIEITVFNQDYSTNEIRTVTNKVIEIG